LDRPVQKDSKVTESHARLSSERISVRALRKRVLVVSLPVLLFTSVAAMTGAAASEPTALTAPTHTIRVGDADIAYRSFGHGRPLVLLQRFRATMDDWDPALLDALARQHRVILVDYAGAGGSTGSPSSSIDGLAEDAASFLSALDIGRADVLGWSLGGMVAQRLALDYPDAVGCLVLASTHPGGGPNTAGPSPETLQLMLKPGPRTEDENLRLFYAPSPAGRALGHASLIRITRREPREPAVAPATVAAHGSAVFTFLGGTGNPAYPELGSLRQPTLIAGGVQDVILPVINSQTLAELIPQSRLVIYPDDAHAFLFTRSQDFSRQVDDFLGGPDCDA
jgi:pimeloyl-ACP methyl ester carboxylesterase